MDTRKATGINKQVKISCGEILFEKTGPPGQSAVACGLSATWGKVANQVIGIIDIQARSFTLLRKGAGCDGEQDEKSGVQCRSVPEETHSIDSIRLRGDCRRERRFVFRLLFPGDLYFTVMVI